MKIFNSLITLLRINYFFANHLIFYIALTLSYKKNEERIFVIKVSFSVFNRPIIFCLESHLAVPSSIFFEAVLQAVFFERIKKRYTNANASNTICPSPTGIIEPGSGSPPGSTIMSPFVSVCPLGAPIYVPV